MKFTIIYFLILNFFNPTLSFANCKLNDPDEIVDNEFEKIHKLIIDLNQCPNGYELEQINMLGLSAPALISGALYSGTLLLSEQSLKIASSSQAFATELQKSYQGVTGQKLNGVSLSKISLGESLELMDKWKENLVQRLKKISFDYALDEIRFQKIEKLHSPNSMNIMLTEYNRFFMGQPTHIHSNVFNSLDDLLSVIDRTTPLQEYAPNSRPWSDLVHAFEIDLESRQFQVNRGGPNFLAIKNKLEMTYKGHLDNGFGDPKLEYGRTNLKFDLKSAKAEMDLLIDEIAAVEEVSAKAKDLKGLDLKQTLAKNAKFYKGLKNLGRVGIAALILSLAHMVYELTKDAPNLADSNALLSSVTGAEIKPIELRAILNQKICKTDDPKEATHMLNSITVGLEAMDCR